MASAYGRRRLAKIAATESPPVQGAPAAGCDPRVTRMAFDVRGLRTVWVGGKAPAQMFKALPDRATALEG